ncbi:hypothetical protein GJ689_23955 [Rhodoplanes serenus]|uniref:Cytochrome P460 domain-containing protein n=1 Tax=Rhodoplanes serenus TaxID=200615 RepID=A0A9X4XQ03_9BRAD|nr:cytochrome P460 family protein [Rhodoplanes serenus]MTW19255.1 hypothetical protein [Rhodoplanes serenus]
MSAQSRLVRTALAGLVLCGLAGRATAGADLVAFPTDFAEGVRYATVERGSIREEIFTSRKVLEAARTGRPLPSGTVITLVDYRDGKLFRYVVMEKRTGWGADYPPEKRNGEWEFQAFNADGSVNSRETLDRCFGCHRGQALQDFVFTLDRMRSAR